MNKFWKIVTILTGFGFLGLATLFALGYFKPKKAGLKIISTPAAAVFLNGGQVGRTPYETTLAPGEVNLKLVPDSGEKHLVSFETRVLLSSGIKTVISRNFAETEAAAAGEVLSFAKTTGPEAALAVVTDPDSAQVSIDGTPRGFAPYQTATLSRGEHQISVSAPGYQERTLAVNTLAGYKLTAIVKLAQSEATVRPSSLAPASPTPKPVMVRILATPNGFLRVRAEPNINAAEVARVEPDRTYTLVEENKTAGWYKIEYEAGKFGWVSGEFAQIETPP